MQSVRQVRFILSVTVGPPPFSSWQHGPEAAEGLPAPHPPPTSRGKLLDEWEDLLALTRHGSHDVFFGFLLFFFNRTKLDIYPHQ